MTFEITLKGEKAEVLSVIEANSITRQQKEKIATDCRNEIYKLEGTIEALKKEKSILGGNNAELKSKSDWVDAANIKLLNENDKLKEKAKETTKIIELNTRRLLSAFMYYCDSDNLVSLITAVKDATGLSYEDAKKYTATYFPELLQEQKEQDSKLTERDANSFVFLNDKKLESSSV